MVNIIFRFPLKNRSKISFAEFLKDMQGQKVIAIQLAHSVVNFEKRFNIGDNLSVYRALSLM